MSIREGLGYNLTYYDPCFNYNQDRFCCSKRGYHFRENVLLSDCQLEKRHDYATPRNYNPADDTVPLWLRETGLVKPHDYTFTPQDQWRVPCSRMPCDISVNKVPCASHRLTWTDPGYCGPATPCGNKQCGGGHMGVFPPMK